MSEYVSLHQRNADGKHLDKIWEGQAAVRIADGEGRLHLDPEERLFRFALGNPGKVKWIQWHGQYYRVWAWRLTPREQTVDVRSDWLTAEQHVA